VGIAFLGVLASQGGSTPDGPSGAGSDVSPDRDDEIEDFTVVWAAPGTIARTLSWQLDPGRSSDRIYRTHAVITDQPLVIVGFPFVEDDDGFIDDDVLFSVPRSAVARDEKRDYKDGRDAKVAFTDGS
jgi:hypothetical protein